MIASLIPAVSGLLDKFIEDKDKKNAMAHEIATMAEKAAHEAAMAQIGVNKAEAGHRSIFVAGWRPFVGWVCAIALAYHFVLQPILVFGMAAANVAPLTLPQFDMDSLMTVLLGMLGLGGLRSYEKTKGLAK
jgi:hypothetical protein